MTKKPKSDYAIQAVANALRLLHVFRDEDEIGVAELARRLGLPKNNVFRLLATMDALLRYPAWEMDADGAWHKQGPGAEDALRQLAASAGMSQGARVSLRG